MQMPRKVIVLLVLVSVLVTGCFKIGSSSVNPPGTTESTERGQTPPRTALLVKTRETVTVYFATADGKNLVPVTLAIHPTEEAAKVALEKLLAGPENNFSLETIPEGTKLKDIYLLDKTAYVDLTGEIKTVAGEQAKMAVEALVLTLTQFKVVDTVQILIEGQIEEKLAGVDISQPLNRPGEINRYGGKGNNLLTIYFSDANAMYLVPVTIAVSGNNLPFEAVAALVKGAPKGSGLFNTIWPGTKINQVRVEDRVAVVDFSAEVLGYGGGAAAESMLVNSVVLTLTQFEEIDAVQFLIDGAKIDFLPEGTDISSPIPAPQFINFTQ